MFQCFVYVAPAGTPATGLTVAVTVIDLSDGSTAASGNCTEIGNGIYKFNHSGYDRTKDYAYFANAGTDSVIGRYQYAFNSSFRTDILATLDTDSVRLSAIKTAVDTINTNLSSTRLAKIDDILTNTLAANGLTLTSWERTAIANTVQAGILNENDSQAIIQAIADKIAATDLQIGDITVEGIAQAVWSETVRTLTVATGMTEGQETILNSVKTTWEANATKLALLERMQRATLRIDGTQIILEDEIGEIQVWDCKNEEGLPTNTNIYTRLKTS